MWSHKTAQVNPKNHEWSSIIFMIQLLPVQCQTSMHLPIRQLNTFFLISIITVTHVPAYWTLSFSYMLHWCVHSTWFEIFHCFWSCRNFLPSTHLYCTSLVHLTHIIYQSSLSLAPGLGMPYGFESWVECYKVECGKDQWLYSCW